MATTFNAQEVQQRLAKRISSLIERVAGDIQDQVQRENLKKSLWATAHEEPGQHEPEAPGVQPHMEPGQDEQFALNPPTTPDAATAEPIVGGSGVPAGQLNDPHQAQMSLLMGDGPCPLCQQPEQNCKCLDGAILGKAESLVKSLIQKNASMGYGNSGGSANAAPPAAMGGGEGGGAGMAMSEGMCKSCGKAHDMAKGCSGIMADTHPPDPTKKAETNPTTAEQNAGAEDKGNLPPANGGEHVKSTDKPKIKGNDPFKKGDVPMAKPPSGKVPGATANPPMASTTSKPGIMKTDNPMTAPFTNPVAPPPAPIAAPIHNHVAPPPAPLVAPMPHHVAPPPAPLVAPIPHHVAPPPVPIAAPMAKAVMPAQAQQHMNIDASKAAAVKPPPPPGAGASQLTHPSDPTRANAHASAMAGEFQPKGPISSGLELAPKGLTAPPPAVRGMPAPAPKLATAVKPAMPAVPQKSAFGHIFGKSEDLKCALCHKAEHVGDCK